MIDREQIGIRIAVLRKKAGLSQQALADKLGVSAQAVSKWEGGKNLPDIDMFRELAWLFRMTIDHCWHRLPGSHQSHNRRNRSSDTFHNYQSFLMT